MTFSILLYILIGLSFGFIFMLPIQTSSSPEGTRYSFPFLGNISERLSERLDISTLYDTGLVDDNGYLIPGSPLRLTDDRVLVPISAGGQTVRGVTLEAVKVAKSNSQADLEAADDFDVVTVVAGTVDRGIAEYNLGREYSANELAAFDANDALVLTDPES